jgi:hypothetical protein
MADGTVKYSELNWAKRSLNKTNRLEVDSSHVRQVLATNSGADSLSLFIAIVLCVQTARGRTNRTQIRVYETGK